MLSRKKNPRPSVTAQDVAELAGVSVSTVSRVLNRTGLALISERTQQRVREAANQLGYSPDPIARALRNQRTHLLGVIVRDINDPFSTPLIDIIGNVAKEHQYDLVFGFASDDPQRAMELAHVLDLRRCDGVFLVGDLKESVSDQKFLEKMSQEHLLVSLCRGSGGLVGNTASISVDNHKGTFAALGHLAGQGHRRIALVDGSRLGDIRERARAYGEFMAQRLGQAADGLAETDEESYAGGYRAAKRLLACKEPPTAIFAVKDTMAVGVLRAIAEAGCTVPADISVVGFDDIPIAPYLHPPLTTVRQPVEQIGRLAVELLMSMVRTGTPPTPLPHLLVEPELIVRDSCSPPAQ